MNIKIPVFQTVEDGLDLAAGERVRWQLLARNDLRLIRLEAPPAKKRGKN